jgi:hypothetical protein
MRNPNQGRLCQLRIKGEPSLLDLKFRSEHLRTHNLKPKGGLGLSYSCVREFTDSQVKELIERSLRKLNENLPDIESHFQSGDSPKYNKTIPIYEWRYGFILGFITYPVRRKYLMKLPAPHAAQAPALRELQGISW